MYHALLKCWAALPVQNTRSAQSVSSPSFCQKSFVQLQWSNIKRQMELYFKVPNLLTFAYPTRSLPFQSPGRTISHWLQHLYPAVEIYLFNGCGRVSFFRLVPPALSSSTRYYIQLFLFTPNSHSFWNLLLFWTLDQSFLAQYSTRLHTFPLIPNSL